MRSTIACLLLIFSLSGCSQYDYGDMSSEVDSDYESRKEAAEEARQAAYAELGADDTGHNADISNIDSRDVDDSRNYRCSDDCSGHEAGFDWASENDVTDERDCDGDSESFEEGCMAFLEARQDAADELAQSEGDEAAQEAAEEYEESDE